MWWPFVSLFLFLLRRVMYSATPESATSFGMGKIQTRCVHDFQSDNVAGQTVCPSLCDRESEQTRLKEEYRQKKVLINSAITPTENFGL